MPRGNAAQRVAAPHTVIHQPAHHAGPPLGNVREVRRQQRKILVAQPALGEIVNQRRIEGIALVADFVVQVRPRTAARAATQTDDIAGPEQLPHLGELAAHVPVERFQAVIMPHQHEITPATGFVSHNAHNAVKGGADGIAGVQVQVGAVMPAVSAQPETGGGSELVQGRCPALPACLVVKLDFHAVVKILGINAVRIHIARIPDGIIFGNLDPGRIHFHFLGYLHHAQLALVNISGILTHQ